MLPFFTGGLLSPDGTTLALQTNGVTTMDIANGHRHTVLTAAQVKALNHDKLANQVSPLAWYPDGTRLLMIALNQSATHCYTFSIGLDGRGYQRVGPKGFCPMRATYSGDGSHFAFLLSEHPGRFGQFRHPADGRGPSPPPRIPNPTHRAQHQPRLEPAHSPTLNTVPHGRGGGGRRPAPTAIRVRRLLRRLSGR